MTTIAFDTLAFANKLKKAGTKPEIAEAQAEATAEIMHDLIIERLVTKEDLEKFKLEMYGFLVKLSLFVITVLGGLQTIFHFVK